MDHAHDQRVKDIQLMFQNGSVYFRLFPAEPTAEDRLRLEEQAGLLEDEFGLKLRFEGDRLAAASAI